MKPKVVIFLIYCFLSSSILVAQTKQTYKANGTTYVSGQTYKSTGAPKVERSSSARQEYLKSQGYNKVPAGYQVDHVVPLSKGGADQPYNMQIISTEQHKAKTAAERSSSTSYPSYSSPTTTQKSTYPAYSPPTTTTKSTYSTPTYSTPTYNAPTYNSNSGKTIYTGSKGGQYYYNSKGNKTYTKRK